MEKQQLNDEQHRLLCDMRQTNREIFMAGVRRADLILAGADACALYDTIPLSLAYKPGERKRRWDGIEIVLSSEVPTREMHWMRVLADGSRERLSITTIGKGKPAPVASVELGDDGLSRVIDALKDAGDRGANGDQIFGWMRAIAIEVRAQRQNAARIEGANVAIHASFEKSIARLDERVGDLDMSKLKPADPPEWFDVVFDGPPSHTSGRFIEVEDMDGKSINVGRWINRGDGMWALRIGKLPPHTNMQCAAEKDLAKVKSMLGLKQSVTAEEIFAEIISRQNEHNAAFEALRAVQVAASAVVPVQVNVNRIEIKSEDPDRIALGIVDLMKEVKDANEAEVNDPAPSKR